MKKKLIKIESTLKQLYLMNEDLGGGSLKADFNDKNIKFDQLLTLFREQIFSIKRKQKERDFKQQKTENKVSMELIKINQDIREGITKAKQILIRAETNANKLKKQKQTSSTLKNSISNKIKNCYQLLSEVKQIESRGTYIPPTVISLAQLKKQLIQDRNEIEIQQEVNIDENEAFQDFNKKDKDINSKAQLIIDKNQKIIANAKQMRKAIDITSDKIQKTSQIVTTLTTKVYKANSDLAEVLKVYRPPSKLCLDITLVVCLLGLIGVVVNMIKSGAI